MTALTGRPPPEGRRLALRRVRDPARGEVLDEALVFFAAGPRTETGEDMAEFHLHGGGAVRRAVMAALTGLPRVRLAAPGEFSRRALAHGRIDLTQAEALADLVAAETEAERRQALRQMDGALGRLYEDWRRRVVDATALAEALIDFPEEDLPAGLLSDCQTQISGLYDEISQHLADGRRGELVREGLSLAILGAPNVGKSTLLNRLAGREAAIVSATAGTTRDVIEVHLDVAGYRVVVADTAGLRATADEVESEGVRRALARAESADIRLVVVDASAPEPPAELAGHLGDDTLLVVNKVDHLPEGARPGAGIALSATTGEGLETLWRVLEARVQTRLAGGVGAPLTRARHRAALRDTLAALVRTMEGDAAFPELVAEDLRMAGDALGRITGRIAVEEILDVVFREFCIGK